MNEAPRRIGRYRVTGRLGEGGMGTVYSGHDDSGRKVAIKVIRREYAADPHYRARFEAEVAAAQRVRPFCTAPVLDADPRAGQPYLVTEFVEGPSLEAAVRNGPLKGADLEALAVGMATALTAIHDAGVVHRDLKPANVLLSPLGPRVIDFGVARSADGLRLTATGGIVGTPVFMSPEQLRGAAPTPASDVFSWGATVAFAARGTPCFAGGSLPAVIHRISSAEPDLDGLDGTVLAVVRAALAKDPADRPTASDVLQRLISSRATPAPESPVPPAVPVPSPWSSMPTGAAPAMYGPSPAQPSAYGYAMPYPATTGHAPPSYNSAAIYALIFGLVGLVTCGLPSIPAIIAGHMAWGQMKRTGQRGMGFAATGIALGYVMLAIWVLILIGLALPDDTSNT